jgi:hypothetical protein
MDDHSPLKLRRSWLSGYRVGDVAVLRARLELTIAHLTQALEAARARLAESEAERERLATEGSALARARADELVEAARIDAARIRAAAALEEQEARTRVAELLRLQDTLATTIRTVTHDFERAMAGAEDPAPAPEPEQPEPEPPAPEPFPAPTPPPPPPAARGFARTVELEAGPFRDFASLSAFEDALGTLSRVDEVYVRRFEGDRATIELTLDVDPAAFLDEMAARLPYTLSVDRADADRIAVHVVGG